MYKIIMHKKCVFESKFGYNSIIRLGKIYNINLQHYIFLLHTHIDLIDYSYILNIFFKICKNKLKRKILITYITLEDIWNRELGITSINKIENKYYNLYFNYLSNKNNIYY